MKRLTRVADLFETDKGTKGDAHMFTEKYDEYFRQYENPKILEIGTYKGGSAQMFNQFYDGQCEIYSLDICDCSFIENFGDNFHFMLMDQGSDESRRQVFEVLKDIKFDIIIDDGSHVWFHQIKTLHDFYPLLSDKGIYVLEDLQYSRLYEDMYDSPLYFLNFLQPNIMLTEKENNDLINAIDSVDIFSRKNESTQSMVEMFGGMSITGIIKFRR